MMMTAGDRIFCDTNVLLSAIDRKRSLNERALYVLNALPNQGVELCVSGQIVREFLVVSTRPIAINGLGLALTAAVENIEAILERSTILEESRAVADRLMRLAVSVECAGKQIHDANVVATMLEHGVTRLVTANSAHFMRYSDIELIDLADLSPQ